MDKKRKAFYLYINEIIPCDLSFCKFILVGHAFLYFKLMILNLNACSIREHNHQMVINIFLLSTNLGWTMGRRLLPQTVKASKYFCALFFLHLIL